MFLLVLDLLCNFGAFTLYLWYYVVKYLALFLLLVLSIGLPSKWVRHYHDSLVGFWVVIISSSFSLLKVWTFAWTSQLAAICFNLSSLAKIWFQMLNAYRSFFLHAFLHRSFQILSRVPLVFFGGTFGLLFEKLSLHHLKWNIIYNYTPTFNFNLENEK